MRRTPLLIVLLFAVIGAGGSLLLEAIVVTTGGTTVIPPITLALTLLTVAVVLLVFAVPIRRRLIGRSRRAINPFAAVRLVAVAKGSALTGALAAGFGGGILVFFTTRPIAPSVESLWLTIATSASGLLLAIAALVAEYLCTLPPEDRGRGQDPDDSAAEPV